ncbi:flagellar brake domain-containing protein [Cytobacillus spongiae]|jgi:c-di-GMP-binding flagellar brake protein YcgR|uniref:flagellar brake protein n=1 Tax=Cytobacillus spongiae TaxID=2901381 RepID=UPI001F376916|nr:flagellar brake domain-containing protein [Cytobacillus spongiae]UII54657.1 flagellar brake domain-containing protein [Cytobacillus spongiae]
MINIGDVLILEPKYSDKIEKYKCKLVESKENSLYIDYPINEETKRTAFFLDGTQLKATFVGKDGSAYMFETEVVGRVKQNIPMIILSYPGNDQLFKIQRRQYVRVESPIDVAIHPMEREFQPFTTVTDDISAGGAAVLFPKDTSLNEGQEFMLWMVLPMQNGEYHYLKLRSKMVRSMEYNEIRNKASIQFLEVSPQERQLLLRFSFDRQLAMKKKGLENY